MTVSSPVMGKGAFVDGRARRSPDAPGLRIYSPADPLRRTRVMAKTGSSIDLSKRSIEEIETLAKDSQTEGTTRREAERERVHGQMRELAAGMVLTLEEVVRL